MIRERFRTSHNVFGNNTTEESEADSSPFNIRLLNTTQEFYSPSEHFNVPTATQTETDHFESTSDQASPFRVIQYTEDETPHQIAKRLTKGKPYVPKRLKIYQALPVQRAYQSCTGSRREI